MWLEAELLRSREQASKADSDIEVRRFQGEARAFAGLIGKLTGDAKAPSEI